LSVGMMTETVGAVYADRGAVGIDRRSFVVVITYCMPLMLMCVTVDFH